MFYESGYPNRFEELRAYYPVFYWRVKEMMAILKAYGELLDHTQNKVETLYANCFIETADEATIGRLEAFLGIIMDRTRTIEERRRMLTSYFSGFGKISASTIREMIKSYTGADVDITFEPFDEAGNNRLDIFFMRGASEILYVSDILFLLQRRIPAHIEYRAICTYRYGITVEAKRTSYIINHEQSGVKWEPAYEANVVTVSSESSAIPNHITMPHYPASNTAGSESGIHHTATTIAERTEAHTASQPVATQAHVELIPCGTIAAHQ